MSPLLSVEGLSVAFPVDGSWPPVVRDLSLRLARGEALGLVGESGCGKSVTAQAIAGLLPPPGKILGGEIRLDGVRLDGDDGDAWRAVRGSRIGFVFQEPATALDPLFSIGAQLAETLRAHGWARDAASRAARRRAVRRRALELLEQVAMADPGRALGAFPHQLSGGQRQRAMIALALAGGPDLLIADEPTTALDVTLQAQVLELLDQLRRELGLAVLLISHDLAVVAETCDRVLVMYAGEAVEEAPVASLFARPGHPYSRGLLAAVPRLGEPDRRLVALAGSVPAPGGLPAGCAFHPRCPEALPACRRRSPELLAIGPAHRSRCLLHDTAVSAAGPPLGAKGE